MHKIVIGLFLLLASFATFANDLGDIGPILKGRDEPTTFFDSLGALFEKGLAPDPASIADFAWSGRCFYLKDPNCPSNAGFILKSKNNKKNAVTTYSGASYWNPNGTPDFYDNQSLKAVMQMGGLHFLFSNLQNNSLEMFQTRDKKVAIRKSQDFLIEEFSTKDGNAGPIGTFAATVRCYFFIKNN